MLEGERLGISDATKTLAEAPGRVAQLHAQACERVHVPYQLVVNVELLGLDNQA